MAVRTLKGWSVLAALLVLGSGLIVLLTILSSSGVYYDFFCLLLIFYPFLILVLSKSSLVTRLARAVVATIYWLVFYKLYVGYMNHPWFAGPETNKCDGPCFGWYSFENQPCYLCLVVVAVVSLTLGMLVFFFLRRWRTKPAA